MLPLRAPVKLNLCCGNPNATLQPREYEFARNRVDRHTRQCRRHATIHIELHSMPSCRFRHRPLVVHAVGFEVEDGDPLHATIRIPLHDHTVKHARHPGIVEHDFKRTLPPDFCTRLLGPYTHKLRSPQTRCSFRDCRGVNGMFIFPRRHLTLIPPLHFGQ